MNLELVCKDLLSIDSSGSFGTKDVVQFLRKEALTKDLDITAEEHACTPTDSNIRILPKNFNAQKDAHLVFQAHLDTEEARALHDYRSRGLNPFRPSLSDNKIHGLGASSGKLDLFCQTYGMSLAQKEKPGCQVAVVGTFGRYQGMVGALRATRHGWLRSKYAIVSEATNSKLVVATKGLALVRIQLPFTADEIQHRTQHDLDESTSSQVQVFSGDHSLKKAFEYLVELPVRGMSLVDFDSSVENPGQTILDLDTGFSGQKSVLKNLCGLYEALVDLERDFLSIRDETFSPPTPTWQLQSIKTLADSVEIIGSCAMLPQVQPEIYEEWMRRIRLACDKMGALLTVLDHKRPFQISSSSELLRVATTSVLGGWEKFSTPNEASLISRLGVECICYGPGERISSSVERVDLTSLDKAIQFYKEMVLRL